MSTVDEDFRQRLEMYLDKALTEKESTEFLTEVKESPACLAEFQKEQSFRELLRSKVSRKDVSADLLNNIRAKILSSV